MDASELLEALDENRDGEVAATWLVQHLEAVRLVDVREPHELEGPLGKVPNVVNVPLLQLVGAPEAFNPDVPVVLVCRSGRRSSQAAEVLRRSGVTAVASVAGGMLAWNLDVLGKASVLQAERDLNSGTLVEAIDRAGGPPEVKASWVHANLGCFRLVDVREAEELEEFGRVAQAEHIPMQEFVREVGFLDKDAPVVVMCASGNRSGRIVSALESLGFTAVASLEGGLFGWRGQDLPAL